MSSLLIELHVPDFSPVQRFYEALGFEVCWEHPPDGKKGYLVLQLEDNILCFWGGNEQIYSHGYFQQFGTASPKGVGVELVLQVSELHSYYEKIQPNIEILEPLQMRPWGLEDFRVVDPFGFYLRITSQFDIRAANYAGK